MLTFVHFGKGNKSKGESDYQGFPENKPTSLVESLHIFTTQTIYAGQANFLSA